MTDRIIAFMNNRDEQTEDFTDCRNDLKFDQTDVDLLHSESGRKLLLEKHKFINDRFMIPLDDEPNNDDNVQSQQAPSRDKASNRKIVISEWCDGVLSMLLSHLSCKEKGCLCEVAIQATDQSQTTLPSKNDIDLSLHHAS